MQQCQCVHLFFISANSTGRTAGSSWTLDRKKRLLPKGSLPSCNLVAEDTFAPVTNVRFGSGTYLHSTSGESPFRPDCGKLLPHENSCLRISIIAVTAFIAVPFVKANRVLEIVLSIQVQPLVSSLDSMLLQSAQ